MMMADDLALMQEGRILQTGSPRDCYLRPTSVPAARLLSETSLAPAQLSGGRTVSAFGEIAAEGEGPGLLMMRPEGLHLGSDGVEATVTSVSFAGGSVMMTVLAGEASAYCRAALAEAPAVGDRVRVRLDPAFCVVFPAT
jgi:iron(III) transport system ATP-binding protein